VLTLQCTLYDIVILCEEYAVSTLQCTLYSLHQWMSASPAAKIIDISQIVEFCILPFHSIEQFLFCRSQEYPLTQHFTTL